MSIDYAPLRPVRFRDVIDGRLERFGVTEKVGAGTTETCRYLTDGNNGLWVRPDADGFARFTRDFSDGPPGRILSAVEEAFDTRVVSEDNPEYWGFQTREEWDKAKAKRTERWAHEDYEKLMKYVRGEKNDIKTGRVGETWARNAKVLISENPELALPENWKALLRAAMTGEWNRDLAKSADWWPS